MEAVRHKRGRSDRGALAFRRPGAVEYGVVKQLGLGRLDALMKMLREIDSSLDDATRAFSGYQIRIHGTLAIAFLMERNGVLHPSVVRFFDPGGKGLFVPRRMTDADVAHWNVRAHWSPGHINLGRPFEAALHAVHDLIVYRRHVMAEVLGMRGEKMIGTVQAQRRADALRRKLAVRLDDMSRKQVRNWGEAVMNGGEDHA